MRNSKNVREQMMKRFYLWIIFFAIFTAIFCSLFFTLLDNFTISRWISFGFIHLAWGLLILNFYSFPQIRGGAIFGYAKRAYAYFLFFIQLILGLLFILINNDNYLVPLFCQAIPFGGGIAGYLVLLSSELQVKNLDQQDKNSMAFIKEASEILQSTMKLCNDWALSKKIEPLLDEVKSSQVKSLPTVRETEENFLRTINKIRNSVVAGETENVVFLLKEAMVILETRNSHIKNN